MSVQWSKVGPPAFMYQPVGVFASRKAIKVYLYERVLRLSDYSAISVAPEAQVTKALIDVSQCSSHTASDQTQ